MLYVGRAVTLVQLSISAGTGDRARIYKKQDTKLLPITSPNVKILSLAESVVNAQQNRCLNISAHLNCVAALPCKISAFKKSQCSRSN